MPGMVRGAFVVGVQHGRGVLLDSRCAGPMAAATVHSNHGRQLRLPDRRPGDRSRARLPHAAKRGELAPRHAEGRRRCLRRRRPRRPANVRRHRSESEAEILSYSRARGAFVGVSIDGSSISLDPAAEAIYYQPPGAFPASAMTLLQTVTAYSAVVAGRRHRQCKSQPAAADRAVGSPPAAARTAMPKPLANNSKPPRASWPPTSTTVGSVISRCRPKCTPEPGAQSAGNATGAAAVRRSRSQPAIRGPASPARVPTNTHRSTQVRRRANRVESRRSNCRRRRGRHSLFRLTCCPPARYHESHGHAAAI